MRIETSKYRIYVPRYIGGTSNHVLVKLTLLHDRTDIPFLKTAFLQVATEMLSSRKSLPDKGEVFVSMTEILLYIIQQQQQIGDME
ncbi:MAG TPA: hypothetical protein VIY48_00605 [Candidatus Paceibacterota bacterium]